MTTQALCDKCWDNESGGLTPMRMKSAGQEKCCMCGASTSGGIFISRSPRNVNYPRTKGASNPDSASPEPIT